MYPNAFYPYSSGGVQYPPQLVLQMAPQPAYCWGSDPELQPALAHMFGPTPPQWLPASQQMAMPQFYAFAPATLGGGVRPQDSHAAESQWHPTKAQIEAAWEKADRAPLLDPDRYRRDCMGAVIQKSKYGQLGDGGWDIDHSKPRSLGGTDHPNNLHALDALTNRADKRDQYPYHYKEHETLGNTLSEFREKHHWEPSNVDGRSALVRNGELRFNLDGSIDERSPAVRDGRVTVNSDGSARANSKAVHDGSLILKD